jgi:hypothetical protein
MRHLGSLALSAVGGAMLYVYLGLGSVRLQRAAGLFSAGSHRGSLDLVIGVGLMVAAGVWVWVLLTLRWSPIGLVPLGLAFGALGLLAVAAPGRLADLLPDSAFGLDGLRSAPPVACLMLAVPLLLTVLSKRRWQGKRGEQRYSDHPIDAPM